MWLGVSRGVIRIIGTISKMSLSWNLSNKKMKSQFWQLPTNLKNIHTKWWLDLTNLKAQKCSAKMSKIPLPPKMPKTVTTSMIWVFLIYPLTPIDLKMKSITSNWKAVNNFQICWKIVQSAKRKKQMLWRTLELKNQRTIKKWRTVRIKTNKILKCLNQQQELTALYQF